MMLYSLQNYLTKHKKLSLHGIGNFVLHEEPARLDFTAKLLYPPMHEIKFDEESLPNNNQFFAFLSRDLKVDKITSVRLYNEEVKRINEALAQSGKYNLQGIGILHKGPNEKVSFELYNNDKILLPVIPVERVIRKQDTHTIRVGEDERTNKHMEELLAKPVEEKKNYVWMYVLIAVLIALIIFLVFYYFK